MRKESGFTLIELVVVIVILGILAAFAVPRFVDLRDEAETASLKGLKGGLSGAASLAHAKWTVNGSDPAQITVQGKTINMNNTSGYPEASSSGIGDMMQDLSGYNATYTSGTPAKATFNLGSANDCNLYYYENGTVTNSTECNF